MQKIYLLLALFIANNGFAQQFEYRIAKHTQEVDSIKEIITELENIGIRETGTLAFDSATYWLTQKYSDMGYSPKVDTFTIGSNKSYNVIIEKPGSSSTGWIIIGAHHDSKNGPGANDNGSGVAATLEIARIIKNVECKVGVRIINFGAEEQGLDGSRHYVNNTLNHTEDIQLIFNIDQIGGTKGIDNSRIKCERDINDNPSTNNFQSSLKTDTLRRLMSLYTNLIPVEAEAYGSDYVPFQNEGYVITGLYQDAGGVPPYTHSIDDVVANMDTDATTDVIRGAVAASLYFARINTPANVSNAVLRQYSLFPNPSTGYFSIRGNNTSILNVVVINSVGQRVYSGKNLTGQEIDLTYLADGLYTVSISETSSAAISYSKLIIAR